jgi:hypothetical protein
MTKFEYQKILDLAATAGWGYEVRLVPNSQEPTPDWWIYITRPEGEYGAWRAWPPGDIRNVSQAARMMAAELGNDLLDALGLEATSQVINALASGLVIRDQPIKFRFRQ